MPCTDSGVFPAARRHRDEILYASDNTAVVAPAVAAWLVANAPRASGFDADTLARVAVIFSLNAHGLPHGSPPTADVSTLFELSSKLTHSCDPNTYYDWSIEEGTLTHKTLRAVAAGVPLTVNYLASGSAESTAVRRHRLVRGKFFVCRCDACIVPDQLAALPCPACTRREADGMLPLDAVFMTPSDALDWEHPCFIPMREHAVAVPDDPHGGAASDGAPPAWRCASCGGVVSAASVLRRANRLQALSPTLLVRATCVMDALGMLENQVFSRLLLDLLHDASRGKLTANAEAELTTMQALVLSHAPFWARAAAGSGGGPSSSQQS